MTTTKQRFHHRHRRKILYTSGMAAFGIAILLAQNNVSSPTTGSDGLPGLPTPTPNTAVLESDESAPEPSSELVDPREMDDVLRNIGDLKREIQRTIKEFSKVQGSGAEVRKLNELSAQVKKFESNIKAAQKSGTGMREAMQDYYDEQIWETVNQARRTIEIPKNIAQITKDQRRLDGLLKTKSFQKLPLDQDALKRNVEAIRQATAEAKVAYESGDLEAAEEALQPIYDGMHPGEVQSVLYRFRDIAGMSNRIKDKEVKAAIGEAIAPVIEAANEGDFREANAILNDSYNDLVQLMRLAMQLGTSRKVNRTNIADLIDRLEQKVNDKAGSFDERESD